MFLLENVADCTFISSWFLAECESWFGSYQFNLIAKLWFICSCWIYFYCFYYIIFWCYIFIYYICLDIFIACWFWLSILCFTLFCQVRKHQKAEGLLSKPYLSVRSSTRFREFVWYLIHDWRMDRLTQIYSLLLSLPSSSLTTRSILSYESLNYSISSEVRGQTPLSMSFTFMFCSSISLLFQLEFVLHISLNYSTVSLWVENKVTVFAFVIIIHVDQHHENVRNRSMVQCCIFAHGIKLF